MAVVEEGTCDGCGRSFDVDDLHVVTINGDEMVCCDECRDHAERAAERARPTCEGCGAPTDEDDLKSVELPDGVEIECCSDCRMEASVDLSEDDRSVGTSGGGSRSSDTSSAGGDRRAASSAGGDRRGGAGTRRSTGSGTDETASSRSSESDEDSKPATTENVCDNCKESFTIELYRVETIDGRTEQFCPDCKREGVEEGIVRDVRLRRSQAFEVLGLTTAADEDSVREAYLRRVKEVHPDREDGNRSEFMLVKRAYERLSDEL